MMAGSRANIDYALSQGVPEVLLRCPDTER